MEQLPIIIDGKTLGQLTVRREGAYVVCRGHAQWNGEGLLRLWLYGRGEPLYVGVLQPDGTVRKRFSLSEFGRTGGGYTHCGNQPQSKEETPNETDTIWYLQPDGTLRCGRYIAFPADGVRLPRGCGGVRRVIEGREYVIFPC
ncbi:MAG: hypothetical protein IJA67_15510 [Oscillospiraceae bacterium]|nr:hypothetical protein [Oscillospiraceae bacterium]